MSRSTKEWEIAETGLPWCVRVCVLFDRQLNAMVIKATIIKVLFAEMYVNLVFVMFV